MAGLWGVAADNANTVSGYPIVEFTSDVRYPTFPCMGKRKWVWVDMGPVSFFDVWYTLSIELLPTGEFKLMAGSYTYTTTTSAPDASVRLKSIILQGHNYDPLVPGAGVTDDIYWDDLAYQICEGTKTYTYTYTDCSGLSSNWVYTYTIDDNTPPTITCPGTKTVYMNTGCTATGVNLGTHCRRQLWRNPYGDQ